MVTEQLLADAKRIAREAGELILEMSSQDRKISYKSERDMVTQVDQAAETFIITEIEASYPDHQILGEEGGARADKQSDYRWIIDPLDGTTNFVHGFPAWCVSIGLEWKGVLTIGVIFDPLRGELFHAAKGQGAYLNEKPIHVSKTETLSKSLLATGFPYVNDAAFDLNMTLWTNIYGKTQGLRRAGAAALDLAWTACGRLDGFWELKLKPWDIAAGALLVTEAGGLVSNLTGADPNLEEGNIVSGNPHIHARLIKEISNYV